MPWWRFEGPHTANLCTLAYRSEHYLQLYNNQINARALIGQSAMFHWASKLMEKSRVV